MEAAAEDTPKENSVNTVTENNVGASDKIPTPPPQDPPKKSKKEERSKKDDKNVEQFMKSLNSVPTLDEKLSIVCKKYVQAVDDNKKMQFYIKQSDKRYALLTKEKEQLQHEFNKTVLVKSKLENLCRELQKQNKAIKEESLLKIRDEEERRKETQTKFQNTLAEITSLLQQNNEKNAKLRDDNISMTEKFKSVMQQYQLREQQVDKMGKQMALESELSNAKLKKASLEYQAEKERLLAEMEHVKITLAQYRAKVMELQNSENSLKGQLSIYTDKYDEFQTALVKSNQVFGGFKEQMEKMSKKIQKLEKESLSWKTRWETSQTALLDMCGQRQATEERAASTGRQLQHMQSLCRTLQAERTALLSTLKDHNIERPPLPAPVPATAPPVPDTSPTPAAPLTPAPNTKEKVITANCEQLRKSLVHLQTHLNDLKIKKVVKEEPPKSEKSKKSKSKKSKAEKQAQKLAEKGDSSKVLESDGSNAKEVQNDDDGTSDEKADDIAMDNLIQAMNLTKINNSDDEVKVDENAEETEVDEVIEITEEPKVPEEAKITEVPKVPEEAKITEVAEVAAVTEITQATEVTEVAEVIEVTEVAEVLPSINDSEGLNESNPPATIEESKENSSVTEAASMSTLELSSNEEIIHLDEVKPIPTKEA